MESTSSQWTQIYDELSGLYYYYNTVTWEVSWDPPTEGLDNSLSALPDADIQKQALEDYYRDFDEKEGESEQKANDSDWIEQYDESSNSVYYYNQATGESSWDPPEGWVNMDGSKDDEGVAGEISYGHYNENGEYVYDYTADPAYWTAIYDESSDTYYYYNSQTQDTQWDIPQCLQQSNSSQIIDNSHKSDESLSSNKIPFSNLKTQKRSKRHSISGPSDYKLDTTHKSSPILTDFKRNPSPTVQFFPKNDKVSNILKYSSTYDIRSNKPTEIDNDISPDESIQNLPNNISKTDVNLSSLSPKLSIDSISKLVYGLSLIDYVRSQRSRLSSSTQDSITMSWSPEPSDVTILALTSSEETKAVKLCCRYIYGFMGDIQLTYESSQDTVKERSSIEFGMKLLSFLKAWVHKYQTSYLPNEIYCQICKQISNNPSISSTRRGWLLLQLCLATFLPSSDMLPYLLSFCVDSCVNIRQDRDSNNESTEGETHALPTNETDSRSSECEKRSLPTVISTCLTNCVKAICFYNENSSATNSEVKISNALFREFIPTIQEIQSLWTGSLINVTIYLPIPHRIVDVGIDSWTTLKSLNKEIAVNLELIHATGGSQLNSPTSSAKQDNNTFKLSISQACDDKDNNILRYSVCEVTSESERWISCHERIADILSKWSLNKSASTKDSGTFYSRLVYKARYFLGNIEEVREMKNDVLRELQYYQAMDEVLSLKYPMSDQDSYILAAYHMYISELSNHDSPKSSSLVNPVNKNFINPQFIADATQKELSRVSSTILALYLRLKASNLTLNTAQDTYLSIVFSWKLFGASLFTVESRTDMGTPSTMMLAVAREGITLVNVETKSFLATFRYKDISSWGHSHNFFLIITGSKAKPVRQYFKTDRGKDIDDVVRVYVESHRRRENKNENEDQTLLQPVVFEKSIFKFQK